jgi:tRNA pseudouridine38/39 synthase
MLTLCSLLPVLANTRSRLLPAVASRNYSAQSSTDSGDQYSTVQTADARTSIDSKPRIKSRMSHNYADWPKERLVSHLIKLENTIKNARRNGTVGLTTSEEAATKRSSHSQAPFYFHHHPTRKIALKFAYAGEHYNGLEHQRDVTPLPTVEETLWDALVKTRLVDPEGTYESHGWEKCGRTDRGVSAAGQVVSFWARCKYAVEGGRPRGQSKEAEEDKLDIKENRQSVGTVLVEQDVEFGDMDESLAAMSGWDESPTNNTLPPPSSSGTPSTDSELARAALSTHDEFDYVSLLNNVLPPSLRVLSWSPVSPSFSARFNCQGRHYKYFFVGRGLDVDAMRDAAQRLVGEHDWRNLCKVDPAKFRLDAEGEERWSFRRVVKRADISLVSSEEQEGLGEMYVFDLMGTAFLYNQVRHIMAVLFLVGSGLENASVVSALLNVDPSRPYPPFR